MAYETYNSNYVHLFADNGDRMILQSSGTINSTTGAGISHRNVSDGNVDLLVLGQVSGVEEAVLFDGTGGGNTVSIGSSGVLFGTHGIRIKTNDNNVVNVAGEIYSDTFGIGSENGSGMDVNVTGRVSGDYGVYLAGADDDTLSNSGNIYGVSSAFYGIYTGNFRIANTGVMSSANRGIDADRAGYVEIYNSGDIMGADSDGIAIQFNELSFAQATTIQNEGTIMGGDAGIRLRNRQSEIVNEGVISGRTYGILSSQLSEPTAKTEIFNFGTISGGDYGISSTTLTRLSNHGEISGRVTLGSLNDIFHNSGAVLGNVDSFAFVDLGAGNDFYFGHGDGHVAGTIEGGAGNDYLDGASRADVIDGEADADVIRGRAGDDTLSGGSENDTIFGGHGDDLVDGGTGRDVALLGDGDDIFNDDAETGYRGDDTVIGGRGDDAIIMKGGRDSVAGGKGDDTISGGADADFLAGQKDDDVLNGQGGVDTIVGGRGDDTLTGGLGADDFLFFAHTGHDVITDFAVGADDIDLSATGVADFAALSAGAIMTDTGAGTLIDFSEFGGSGTVLIAGVSLASLTAGDFIF
ncbi:hypothetical protein NBRC116590_27080 [Pelagimonas sp. KU-00592-HH]|uniref:calcium-binding protein n=1 Tax=Pelagimonas sp. KU-00592-HH TaxID=3127651 RepID=UPI003109EE1A